MKKLFILVSVGLFLMVSCGRNPKADVHVHEDGTVHSGKTHIEDSTLTAQEEFHAEPDSIKHDDSHSHDSTHKHQ